MAYLHIPDMNKYPYFMPVSTISAILESYCAFYSSKLIFWIDISMPTKHT
jgi:hypothetical protein